MEKAKRSLAAATVLFERDDYDFAASRAYYAMFYMAEAALIERRKTYSKHAGVISGFYQEFVATKLIEQKFHQMLHQAFEDRTQGDYTFMDPFPKKEADELLTHAEHFLKRVEGAISYL